MHLPDFLRTPAELLIGSECYVELVEKLNVTHTECLKHGLSRGLGLGIVAGSSIVKVPQIVKILAAQSAAGISAFSCILETLGYVVTLAYNLRQGNPFTTYGESAFLSVQNAIILTLVLSFGGRLSGAAVAVAAFASIAYLLAIPGYVSNDHLGVLQTLTIPIIIASRGPQIIANYSNGNTGQLSAFTVFNYLLGSAARIFTTIKEANGDVTLLAGFGLATFLNAVLAAQMVYYWNATPATADVTKHTVLHSLSVLTSANADEKTSCDPIQYAVQCRAEPNLRSQVKKDSLPLLCVKPTCYTRDGSNNCWLYLSEEFCYYRWASSDITPGYECPGPFSLCFSPPLAKPLSRNNPS
ncbi:PQ-loop-domain-containing protein [Ramicandelaber brevisporus]|nr:PQ-loop-domain-containing protein [Ramicandelaber brevisporus]